MWQATVLTLFPQAFPAALGVSLIGKALEDKKWSLETVDLRNFGQGKHRHVDDTPSGGGAGLVLRPDVLGQALESVPWQGRILAALTPRGKPFTQRTAEVWSKTQGVVLVCGRFEGFDQRLFQHYPLHEVSVGDMVLCGGEVAAQVMLEATVRLLPQVIGSQESLENESFQEGLLEHPQYTRPHVWKNYAIPSVLTSGNHNFVDKWRKNKAEQLTKSRRPDMWSSY